MTYKQILDETYRAKLAIERAMNKCLGTMVAAAMVRNSKAEDAYNASLAALKEAKRHHFKLAKLSVRLFGHCPTNM